VTNADDVDVLLELDIGNIAGGGGCVGRAPDGRVVFVRHALPGERVMARVTAATTSFCEPMRWRSCEPRPTASPPRVRTPVRELWRLRLPAREPGGQRRLKAFRAAEQLHHSPAWSVTSTSRLSREIPMGSVGGPGPMGVDPAGGRLPPHRSHELELVESCPIACPEAMETGAFHAAWPASRRSRSRWRPIEPGRRGRGHAPKVDARLPPLRTE